MNMRKKIHEWMVKKNKSIFKNPIPKTIKANSIAISGWPIIPLSIIPRVAPYIFFRDEISLSRSIKTYKGINNIESLHNHKESDTLAILGSGASINELDRNDYKFISSIDSIALNWWGVYHDFAPDFYKFELGYKYLDRWISGINSKSDSYEDTIFIYEPERTFQSSINTTELLKKLDENITKDIVDIRLFKYFKNSNNDFNPKILKKVFPRFLKRFLHFRGSLSQAIAIGYYLNYKNIILFGIDLNNSKYFFSDHPKSHKKTDQGKKPEEKHATASDDNFKSIDDYVKYLNNKIFKNDGKQMYIGTKNSLLYPDLPYFRRHFKKELKITESKSN